MRVKGSLGLVVGASATFGAAVALAVLDGPWWMWLTALSAGLTVASQIERSPN